MAPRLPGEQSDNAQRTSFACLKASIGKTHHVVQAVLAEGHVKSRIVRACACAMAPSRLTEHVLLTRNLLRRNGTARAAAGKTDTTPSEAPCTRPMKQCCQTHARKPGAAASWLRADLRLGVAPSGGIPRGGVLPLLLSVESPGTSRHSWQPTDLRRTTFCRGWQRRR